MVAQLDLQELSQDEHRDRLFSHLEGMDPGETVSIINDTRENILLNQYQILRQASLVWESEQQDSGSWTIQVTKGEPFAPTKYPRFDVRDFIPQRRHEVLLETFDALDPDQGFLLVNDHDPKPLYHELRSTRGETFGWEYINEDPDEWCVKIVKTEPSSSPDDEILTKYDVRDIPQDQRHSTIHHRYEMIPEGETMEIIASHKPTPLRHEFQQQYGDTFTWDIVENNSDRCRVRITKTEPASKKTSSDQSTGTTTETAPPDPSLNITKTLDVRDLPPAQRHEKIFTEYDDLSIGQGFVLINDHDPEPLYYQFKAEEDDTFQWEYQQKQPGEFKVLIGKAE